MLSFKLSQTIKAGWILLFSSITFLYAADQTINLKAELTGEGDAKACSVSYIDKSSSSNCEVSDNCTSADECICVTAGTKVKWKSNRSDDKFKFKVTKLPDMFDASDDCKLDKLKKSHKCTVKSNPTAGSFKYDFVGQFKGDDKEYPCQYDPTIIIKSQESAPTAENE